MKLNTKLRIIIAIFTFVSLLAVYAFLSTIGTANYSEVEKIMFTHSMETYGRTLYNRFEDIYYILYDWAKWDATYNFVSGENPNYIKDNIPDSVYEDLEMDYILIEDENDAVLYSGYNNGSDIVPIDESEVKIFSKLSEGMGLLLINNDLVFYAATSINNNEGTVEDNGSFVFGYTLDETVANEISDDINADFDFLIESESKDLQSNDIQTIYGFDCYIDYTQTQPKIVINIPIENSEYIFSMRINTTESINELQNTHLYENMIIVSIVLIFVSFLLDIILRKYVVDRVIKLNQQIDEIKETNNLSSRVKNSGNDEIQNLSQNINELLEEIESMHTEAVRRGNIDEMTGVYNRRAGIEIINKEIELFKTNDVPFSIIYSDIDNLKEANDQLGHNIGDNLITDSVNILKSVLPENGIIIRLGGDEFLVLLRNCSLEKANDFRLEIQKKSLEYNTRSNNKYDVSISCGVVEYKSTQSIDEFIEQADRKMYDNKISRKPTN
jgi:diguanylate cyclase (GGDEF)-like protein